MNSKLKRLRDAVRDVVRSHAALSHAAAQGLEVSEEASRVEAAANDLRIAIAVLKTEISISKETIH